MICEPLNLQKSIVTPSIPRVYYTKNNELFIVENILDKVNRAFSKADTRIYDSYGENNIITYARNIVYSNILSFLRKGDKILDLAAGTGSDSVFFAKKGYQISALDLSNGMIKQIQRKVIENNFQNNITVYHKSYTDLVSLEENSHDYIISNFGGLNCIPDLKLIKNGFKHVLKSGGYVTLVIMPPVCPWELLHFPKNRTPALRRLKGIDGKGVSSQIAGEKFKSYYFTPGRVIRALGEDFVKIKLQGLCVFTPPLYMDHQEFAIRRTKLFNILKKIDYYTSNLPIFNSIGDFFILTMRYSEKKKDS